MRNSLPAFCFAVLTSQFVFALGDSGLPSFSSSSTGESGSVSGGGFGISGPVSVSVSTGSISGVSISTSGSAGEASGLYGSTAGSGSSAELPPVGPTLTGGTGLSQTLCEKYSTQLYGSDTAATEHQFMSSVISRAVLGNQTATFPGVPGLFANNSLTFPFFHGDLNYTTNPTNYIQSYQQSGFNATAAFGEIAAKFVSYFGYGLGCTASGFPSYQGNPNMTAIHHGMHINWAQMQYFDQQIALSLLSFGVSQQDVQTVALPYLYDFNRYPSLHDGTIFPTGSYGAGQLSGYPITEDEICSDISCPVAPPAYSFCEKYTAAIYGLVNATYEQDLITNIVSRAFLGGAANGQNVQGIASLSSPLLPFFNSTLQYRSGAPNYVSSYQQHGLDPNYDFGKLAAHLVEYLGPFLGCRDSAYPTYAGNSNLQSVHSGMNIHSVAFNYFVQQIQDSETSFGASLLDVQLVSKAFSAFERGDDQNEICNQQDCPCQTGFTADSNGNCVGTSSGGSSTGGGTATGTGGNGNGNGNSNGTGMITPSFGGFIAAAITAVVALLL